jgi:hypothetical protein
MIKCPDCAEYKLYQGQEYEIFLINFLTRLDLAYYTYLDWDLAAILLTKIDHALSSR